MPGQGGTPHGSRRCVIATEVGVPLIVAFSMHNLNRGCSQFLPHPHRPPLARSTPAAGQPLRISRPVRSGRTVARRISNPTWGFELRNLKPTIFFLLARIANPDRVRSKHHVVLPTRHARAAAIAV